MRTRWIVLLPNIVASAGLSLLSACHSAQGGSTAMETPQPKPSEYAIAQVPLGDLAGVAHATLGSTIKNPYANDPQAVQQGKELFLKMNCAGCHGYGAKGAMGPNLTDQYWRYGGVPVDIYKSIAEGRPQGMPAWNQALPPGEIWKIVAYIQSLGGSFPAADYQASLEGDRVGELVSTEVVAPNDTGSTRKPTSKSVVAPPSPEARPDAGGNPPGSKP